MQLSLNLQPLTRPRDRGDRRRSAGSRAADLSGLPTREIAKLAVIRTRLFHGLTGTDDARVLFRRGRPRRRSWLRDHPHDLGRFCSGSPVPRTLCSNKSARSHIAAATDAFYRFGFAPQAVILRSPLSRTLVLAPIYTMAANPRRMARPNGCES